MFKKFMTIIKLNIEQQTADLRHLFKSLLRDFEKVGCYKCLSFFKDRVRNALRIKMIYCCWYFVLLRNFKNKTTTVFVEF